MNKNAADTDDGVVHQTEQQAVPLLSNVMQEEQHGLIADIHKAIKKNEYDEEGHP